MIPNSIFRRYGIGLASVLGLLLCACTNRQDEARLQYEARIRAAKTAVEDIYGERGKINHGPLRFYEMTINPHDGSVCGVMKFADHDSGDHEFVVPPGKPAMFFPTTSIMMTHSDAVAVRIFREIYDQCQAGR